MEVHIPRWAKAILAVLTIIVVVGFIACGSSWVANVNAGRSPMLGAAPQFATASVFTASWPAVRAIGVNKDGYMRARRHIEQDCVAETSGTMVVWRLAQETTRMGSNRAIWLQYSSGGRSHRINFYGNDLVIQPKKGSALVMTCAVSGSVVASEVLSSGARER